MPARAQSERTPLLPQASTVGNDDTVDEPQRRNRLDGLLSRRAGKGDSSVAAIVVFSCAIFALVWLLTFQNNAWDNGRRVTPPRKLPKDPLLRATALLEAHPLIDGHIDLPILARARYSNQVEDMHLERPDFGGHVNIPLINRGKLGGFFWSIYMPCPKDTRGKTHFTEPHWLVRDTLEQIDVTKLLISKYPETFQLVTSATSLRTAFSLGKVSSLLGMEGAHMLDNSLATLRQYYELGVRYLTLTHVCNNAFAGSCGFADQPIEIYGLTKFGRKLVREMNRLGMIVDISHTSASTARDVLQYSLAPPIFSHSNAASIWNVSRNVPDDVLELVADRRRNKAGDGLVMATFAPQFVSQTEAGVGEKATLERVADHIEYLASKVGRAHVGIGSDFDGILSTPKGLEDVSKYPHLMAELLRRGWSDEDIIGLAGANFVRVFERVEKVAHKLRHHRPDTSIYGKRKDLPMRW